MTTTPEPQREAAFFAAIRRWGITRGPNGVIGGVVEGLGARVGMARVPARWIFVIAAIVLTGLMLLTYAAAWALLPDTQGRIIIQDFGRGVTNVGALIGIAVLTLFGLGSLDAPFRFTAGPIVGDMGMWDGGATTFSVLAILFAAIVPLLILAGLVWLVIYLVRRNGNGSGTGSTPPATSGSPTSAAATPPASAASASPGNSADATAPPTATYAVPPSPPPPPPTPTAPPVAYAPPTPPRPRVPGPGRGGYLSALGLAVIAAAAVAWTSRVDQLAVNPVLAWFAVYLVGLGLILMIVSLTGRKLGFLGFISVPLAVTGLVLGIYGDDIRDKYESAKLEWQEDWAVEFGEDDATDDAWVDEPSYANPTEIFADDYSQIYFTPQCYTGSLDAHPTDATQARIALGEVTEDIQLDITAEYTEITVPAGTNLVLDADGFAQSTVAWNDRDLWCDFWDGDQKNFSLINPGEPTVTLTVYDDAHANTIHVTEIPDTQEVTQ